jgi:hypothetical protein
MRFMMIQFPKSYIDAKPGTVPDLKDIATTRKYNEEVHNAGVLLALDGLTPPSTMSARHLQKRKIGSYRRSVHRSEGSGRRLLADSSEIARRRARMGLAHPRLG